MIHLEIILILVAVYSGGFLSGMLLRRPTIRNGRPEPDAITALGTIMPIARFPWGLPHFISGLDRMLPELRKRMLQHYEHEWPPNRRKE
jgi:hypothetical protein